MDHTLLTIDDDRHIVGLLTGLLEEGDAARRADDRMGALQEAASRRRTRS